MKKLLYNIEYLRQEMYVMALENGISHPDVLMVSQKLDEVINKFFELELNQKVG